MSIAQQLQGNFALVRAPAMLENVDALPSTQGEPSIDDGNGELHARQRCAQMSGHVVGTLVIVFVSVRVFGSEGCEEALQV